MPDEVLTDVTAESSPATETTGQPAPAGAENTEQPAGQPQEKLAPFHTHPRFQQVIRENQQLKQAVGQLGQQMQALQQKSQQQGGLSPDEQQQYTQAAQALRKVIEADPELKELLGLKQEVATQLKQVREGQVVALERQGVDRILSKAKEFGYPQDDDALSDLIERVEARVLKMDNGRQRFLAGDLTVFDDALKTIKSRDDKRIDSARREQTAATLATKDRTRSLPPAPRGGAAGPPGVPKLVEGKEREFTSGLHKAAQAMLNERQG